MGITEMNESNDSEFESTVETGGSPANHGALTPKLTPPGKTIGERFGWLCREFPKDGWGSRFAGFHTPTGQYILPGDDNNQCTGPLMAWIWHRFGALPTLSLGDRRWVALCGGKSNTLVLNAPTQIEAVIALIVELYLNEAAADRMEGK